MKTLIISGLGKAAANGDAFEAEIKRYSSIARAANTAILVHASCSESFTSYSSTAKGLGTVT